MSNKVASTVIKRVVLRGLHTSTAGRYHLVELDPARDMEITRDAGTVSIRDGTSVQIIPMSEVELIEAEVRYVEAPGPKKGAR